MSMTTRVDDYLNRQHINYTAITHLHSNSSYGSAITAQIPPMNIAKAIILQDHESRHLMAILSADRKINIEDLSDRLHLRLHLLEEQQVYALFTDCEQGAVPAFSQAYYMNAVYDRPLSGLADIYLEAGDHETLIHLDQQQFAKLMKNTMYTDFSYLNVH